MGEGVDCHVGGAGGGNHYTRMAMGLDYRVSTAVISGRRRIERPLTKYGLYNCQPTCTTRSESDTCKHTLKVHRSAQNRHGKKTLKDYASCVELHEETMCKTNSRIAIEAEQRQNKRTAFSCITFHSECMHVSKYFFVKRKVLSSLSTIYHTLTRLLHHETL